MRIEACFAEDITWKDTIPPSEDHFQSEHPAKKKQCLPKAGPSRSSSTAIAQSSRAMQNMPPARRRIRTG